MPITWADLPLTANQQQAMQYFASIAPRGGPGGGGAVVPTASLPQAKGAREWLYELRALVGPALAGAQYTVEYWHQENAKAYDQANPAAGL